jgi:phosphoenolpyruvate-protein phosphotransferase
MHAAQPMAHEYVFQCPLPNGLHARPASRLADVAGRFAADITLTNERTGAVTNAKSVLAIVAADIKWTDACRLRSAGPDAEAADAALRDFITNVLPGCDEPLAVMPVGTEVVLPRLLRAANVRWYAGTAACPGIGRGTVVLAGGLALPAHLAREAAVSRQQEQERINRAVAAVRATLEARLAQRPAAIEAGILQAHLAIVRDVALAEKIAELVAAGAAAGRAIVEAAEFFVARLEAAQSIYVRERAVEVEDIALQLLEQIYGERFETPGLALAQPAIIVAENLTPRQLLALDKQHVRALVLEQGGATSHAVILARSFDIPTLTGVAEARAILPAGRDAIVDANLGIVIPEVSAAVQRYYDRAEQTQRRRRERFARHVHAPAATRDGQGLEVAANVGTAEELAPAIAQGADGIGLFRTEMLFMDRGTPPTEDEQLAVYVQAARAAQGRAVIIRTIDVGGDKPVPYLHLPREANPYLGYRGVRVYPEHQAVFRAQLRAILRASAFGKVWLMVPMVCAVEEVRWVQSQLAVSRAELKAGGVVFDPGLPVGIMVEVPAAAFLIDQLAAEVDFFSIGTNDLAQYFLALDRGSDKVAALYNTRHPAFLRLLAKIVADAHRHRRWVGLCGEMARSAANLPLLIGLGLDEISTAAPAIPALKAAVAQSSAADCRRLLEQALQCRTLAEVDDVVGAFRNRSAASGLLEPELIIVDSDSASKEEAVQELVGAFFAAGRTDHPQAVEEAVWAREGVYSTGLGDGFAIPHCKTDAIAASSIGVVRLARPLDWDAVDGAPVQCVILLAMRATDTNAAHLSVFSKLARKLMDADFRTRLLAAPNREAVLACLKWELGDAAERDAPPVLLPEES